MTLGEMVIELKADVSGLRSQLKQAEGIAAQSQGKLVSVAGAIKTAFGMIGVGLGVAELVGQVRKAVEVGTQFQKATTGVAAVMGVSTTAIENNAKALATEMFSSLDVAKAFKAIAQTGDSVTDVNKTVAAAVSLATAAETDLATASKEVETTLRLLGLSGADAARVANTLGVAVTRSGESLGSMATAVQRITPFTRQLGWTLEETSSVITEFAKAGIAPEQTLSALRMGMAALSQPSAEALKILQEHGVTQTELAAAMNDPVKLFDLLGKANLDAGEAVKVFGVRASAMNAVVKGGSGALREHLAAMKDMTATSAIAEKKSLDLAAAQQKIKAAFETLQVEASTGLIPVITDLSMTLVNLLKDWNNVITAMRQGRATARQAADDLINPPAERGKMAEVWKERQVKAREYYTALTYLQKQVAGGNSGLLSDYANLQAKFKEWAVANNQDFQNSTEFVKAYGAAMETAAAKAEDAKKDSGAPGGPVAPGSPTDPNAALNAEREAAIARSLMVANMYDEMGMAAEAYQARAKAASDAELLVTVAKINSMLELSDAQRAALTADAEAAAAVQTGIAEASFKSFFEISEAATSAMISSAQKEGSSAKSIFTDMMAALAGFLSQKATLKAIEAGAMALMYTAEGNFASAGLMTTAATMWGTLAVGAGLASASLSKKAEGQRGSQGTASGGQAKGTAVIDPSTGQTVYVNARTGQQVNPETGKPTSGRRAAYGAYAPGATEMLIGERGPELVLPPALTQAMLTGKLGGTGGNTNASVNITVNGATDPVATGREVKRALDDYLDRQGVRLATTR